MIGILRYGAYIPYLRLPRSEIARAWGGGREGGERAVANHDEDSLTLATEAARDCLHGFDRSLVDAVFFASTTFPYLEKQGAGFLASVLDLPSPVLTSDFANCLRAGTTALELARAGVESGRARNVLVVAADMRLAHPGSALEGQLGDGAAAFLVGRGEAGAVWESFHSWSNEALDCWRTDEDRFVRTWEERWAKQHGLLENVSRSVRSALDRARLSPRQVDRAVLPGTDSRSQWQLAKSLGLDGAEQLAPSLLDVCGSAGAAHVPMMLAAVLEQAGPGDRILVAGYGDGTDVLLLRATEHVQALRPRRGLSGHLGRGSRLANYERYLWYRKLVEVDPPPPLLVGSSATALWRDRNSVFRLHGCRCLKCGACAFPVQRICNACQARDQYEEIPLAEDRGRLFTFTKDYLASRVDPPLIQSVLDMEAGCRIYTWMTDAEPDDVELGMEVEMTFRRIRKAEGFYNYFWKCRPVR
ncbi:MAG: OB-fold domain-containing protein [bacterium]